ANVLGVIIVVITLLVSIMTITRTQRGDTEKDAGIASVFGYAFMPVYTDSMEPEFNAGDLIITKLYNGDGSDLNEGDIITFKFYVDTVPSYNTHRIYKKNVDTEYADGNDSYWFITRGDHNPDENYDGEPDVDYVTQTPYNVVATYTGVHLRGVGDIIIKLQTEPNFYFLVVVTPLIALFVIYVFFFIRAIVQAKMQQTREEAFAAAGAAGTGGESVKLSLDELSDDEKLQLLLELQAKKAVQNELKTNEASAEKKTEVPSAEKTAEIPKAEDTASVPIPEKKAEVSFAEKKPKKKSE
ncbi:MAG TPA: signal peptidase I, partial [Clostridia bacterium]|nr:signal peptidase I [Clostridia bacterium]